MSGTTAHYEDTDLAVFAMQLLDDEGHHAMAEHVRDCVFCRQELARLQGDLAACAYGVEMIAPASSVRERLMHRVGREPKSAQPEPIGELRPATQWSEEPTAQEEEPRLEVCRRSPDTESEPTFAERHRRSESTEITSHPRRTMLKGVFGWLGWAIAAGFAIVGVRLYQQQMDDRTRSSIQSAEVARLRANVTDASRLIDAMNDPAAQRILLSSPEENPGSLAEGHVIYIAEKGSLILLADHLAPVGIDKTYELWLIPADGSDPVPAGTFRPDPGGNGSVILPSLPRSVSAKAFGITVENGAGSQTPTKPIVLAGS